MNTLLKSLAGSGTAVVRLVTENQLEIEGTLNLYQEESDPANDAVRLHLNRVGDYEPDRIIRVRRIEALFVKAVA